MCKKLKAPPAVRCTTLQMCHLSKDMNKKKAFGVCIRILVLVKPPPFQSIITCSNWHKYSYHSAGALRSLYYNQHINTNPLMNNKV